MTTTAQKTSIPVSFYLSSSPEPVTSHASRSTLVNGASGPPAQIEPQDAESGTATEAVGARYTDDAVDSDTIVVDTLGRLRNEEPPVITERAPRHIQRVFPTAATPTSRKRRAETVWAQGPKRARTRARTIPVSASTAAAASAPLTPPATPRIFTPNTNTRAAPQPQPLPPTSIVTTRNRKVQDFHNGITSVQVRPAHGQRPVAETGLVSRELQKQRLRNTAKQCSQQSSQAIQSQPVTAEPVHTEPEGETTSSSSPQENQQQAVLNTSLDGYVQPAVNWDCHTHVLQDQKIYTTYEKPSSPIPSSNSTANTTTQSYNKMTTKTVTITITTTIATTEILRPGEPGYEASLERHRRQVNMSEQEKERMRREYNESRMWASADGSRKLNEEEHWRYHRAAEPGKMPVPSQFGNKAPRCPEPSQNIKTEGDVKRESSAEEVEKEVKVVKIKQEMEE